MNNPQHQNLIIQAIEMTSNWDIDDEHLADAIQSQAELLAGLTVDSSEPDYDFH